ncbi:MAG: response regulator [Bacteroidetes bacterium]|nr:response regulator [Bacteroidota bacterium]
MTAYITIDQEQLRIKITDTGIGIAKEDQLHLFTPFYQAKNSSDDSQLGTGLGLSLVNELVKLHQGEIGISSKMNEGTTVDITLPVLTAGQPSEKLNRTSTHSNLTKLEEITDQEDVTATHEEYEDSILVIEDNPDVRNYVTSCFKNEYTVYTAKNGQEGMATALLHIPTIIISDIMMPISDGMDLTAKVKSDERTSHIPVVLLTAKVDSASRLTGLKLGADDYLVKPFSTEELKVRVSNLIDQRKRLIAKFRLQLEVPPPTPKDLSLDERFLMRAKEVVMSNLNNAQFGVELLADQMHLSRAQLFRKFKALIGTSPSEFISDLRLQRAAELITAKADTLSQISYQVGFNEYSYFAKRFRKKFGLSPSEYAAGEDQPNH